MTSLPPVAEPPPRGVNSWADFPLRAMVSVLALVLFAIGRVVLWRASLPARKLATLGAGMFITVLVLATVWRPGKLDGDGWANLGVFVDGLVLAFCVGAASILAVLLHRLHALLDEEGRNWPGVIASGWRQALWMFGEASRGEFWGFVLFAVWAWGLAVPLGWPWMHLIGLALLVPLWSVSWRRALSLTRAEIAAVLAIIGLIMIDLIWRQHR